MNYVTRNVSGLSRNGSQAIYLSGLVFLQMLEKSGENYYQERPRFFFKPKREEKSSIGKLPPLQVEPGLVDCVNSKRTHSLG